jgi:hypothetical protein
MIGEAVIGTDTVEHWNRINPTAEPKNGRSRIIEETTWT